MDEENDLDHNVEANAVPCPVAVQDLENENGKRS